MYDLLINLTGGLDSTYACYQFLKNNPTQRLLIHHCKLSNYQKRDPYEAEAIKNILDWFNRHGMTNYDYIETELNVTSIGASVNDIEAIGFMTSCILRSASYRCRAVAITASAQDLNQGSAYLARSHRRFELIKIITQSDVVYTYPIKHLNRQQMLKELPKELISYLWFCRFPDNGKPCGRCKTCRWTLPYIKTDSE